MNRYSKLLHIIPLVAMAFAVQARDPLPREYNTITPRKASIWLPITLQELDKAAKESNNISIQGCVEDIKKNINPISDEIFETIPVVPPSNEYIRIHNNKYFITNSSWYPLESKINSTVVLIINFCSSIGSVR